MRNLARLFQTTGPVNWDVARQFAQWSAAGGQPEPNVDPAARVRIEELLRVAELHVRDASGFDLPGGGMVSAHSVTPTDWALRTLEAWRPLLERLATAAAGMMGPASSEPGTPDDSMTAIFGNLPQMLGPFLFGMQSGSMVGELGQRAMGQYDLPMPRPPADELLLVPVTIDAFASDWSLPPDDVRLWVCLREVANHTVLGRNHVRERLDALIGDYVGAFDPDTGALEERLAGLDPTDLSSLQSALGDPASLLSEMQNDRQRQLQVPLQALLCVVTGWVDHVMDKAGRRLIDSYPSLTEALHRRRLEDHSGARALGRLFGVELDADAYARGQRFVEGVIERAGEDGLGRLWRSAAELPTPAEVDAPGLWLARIDLELPEGPSSP
jgi:putative hydrolase